MSVTIIDIANITGVSYTTVSRALNGKKGVSDKMRKKIIDVADEMGYHPNDLARGLVNKSTMTIGLIIPDITNPFFPAIARGVEHIARKHDYNVFLYNTNWDVEREKECIAALKRSRVDGIIINPASNKDFEHITSLDIPKVFLSTKVKSDNSIFLGVDNVYGACLATDHLISENFNRIAFIGGTTHSYSNNMRLRGYKKSLTSNGIKVSNALIKNGKFSSASGYQLTMELLKQKKCPDAIFAANDIIALGVLEALQEEKNNISNGFGVVGFDNIYISDLPQIMLSTIDIPTYFMGEKSFEMLFQNLQEDQYTSSMEYIIKPNLIQRKTNRLK